MHKIYYFKAANVKFPKKKIKEEKEEEEEKTGGSLMTERAAATLRELERGSYLDRHHNLMCHNKIQTDTGTPPHTHTLSLTHMCVCALKQQFLDSDRSVWWRWAEPKV